jgi:Fe-S cluster assembly protein SufD
MAQIATKQNLEGNIHKALASAADLAWLDEVRREALVRFEAIGFPATNEEEWRFTNLSPITRGKFAPGSGEVTEDAVALAAQTSFGVDAVAELVFINGHFAPTLSRVGKLPHGAFVGTLEQGLATEPAVVRKYLGKGAEISLNPFVTLNLGEFRDAAFIHAPRGATIEGSIHLIFISTSSGEAIQSHPRVLAVADDNSEISLVKTFVSGSGVHFTNPVTEIFTGSDCRISHDHLHHGGDGAHVVSNMGTHLGRGSRLISHSVTLGGKLTRNGLAVRMAGEGADATLNGLVILNKDQHCDNHTLLDHAAPNCPSHELYKHVLNDRSTCVFKGKILVRQPAQKTDSKQTSKSLLLSDDAQMNSQPALEIYADDVKCTHGSTTGPVDEDMVFYLRSRGVSLEAARHLLTYAFAADITRRIKVEPVRRRVEDYLAAQHGLPRDLRITDLGEHDEKAR